MRNPIEEDYASKVQELLLFTKTWNMHVLLGFHENTRYAGAFGFS